MKQDILNPLHFSVHTLSMLVLLPNSKRMFHLQHECPDLKLKQNNYFTIVWKNDEEKRREEWMGSHALSSCTFYTFPKIFSSLWNIKKLFYYPISCQELKSKRLTFCWNKLLNILWVQFIETKKICQTLHRDQCLKNIMKNEKMNNKEKTFWWCGLCKTTKGSHILL